MVAIIDYGVGNLFSLQSSFAYIGAECTVTSDENVIRSCDRIILPGVGAFEDAAAKLKSSGMAEVLLKEAKDGKYIMGICLGMQLLFEQSLEYGCHEGLGFIPGVVRPLAGAIPQELKIPHIGWNALSIKRGGGIYRYTDTGDCVYFVHSYYGDCPLDYVTANAEYGIAVTASVQRDNIIGTQYHPEKSGEVGLKILKAFTELK